MSFQIEQGKIYSISLYCSGPFVGLLLIQKAAPQH